MEEDFRDEVAAKEREAEEQGALGGLMNLVNEGLWEVLERDEQVALVLDADTALLRSTQNLLQLRDQKGNKVGEWVSPEKAEQLRSSPQAQFVSDDFVLYRGVKMEGRPFFVLPEVDFGYLLSVEGISNVTSASPSGSADLAIRERLGYEGSGFISHLVGFDLEPGKGTRPSGPVAR